MELTILIPKPGSVAGRLIDPGSGVVSDNLLVGARILVYYEGGRFGNLPDWQERVRHAADRLVTKYPTVARAVCSRDEFDVVGVYHYPDHTFQLTDVVPLAVWLGHHPADARMNPSIYKQRVPCLDCPFRKDAGGSRHGAERAAEYLSYFLTPPGTTFPCHKSVAPADTREGWSAWQEGQVLCSGGLLFAAKQNVYQGVAALGMACGWYDPAVHTPEELALVFDSPKEMLTAHDEGNPVDATAD